MQHHWNKSAGSIQWMKETYTQNRNRCHEWSVSWGSNVHRLKETARMASHANLPYGNEDIHSTIKRRKSKGWLDKLRLRMKLRTWYTAAKMNKNLRTNEKFSPDMLTKKRKRMVSRVGLEPACHRMLWWSSNNVTISYRDRGTVYSADRSYSS